MELIGVFVVALGLVAGYVYIVKHGTIIGHWILTPHYTKEHSIKLLKRRIEDIQEEIAYLESKEKG